MSDWQDVIQRAKADADFRNRLKANPPAACKEVGVSVPAGTTVKVIERQPQEVYLMLDAIGDGELDDAALEGVAGGTGFSALVAAQQAKAQLMDEEAGDLAKAPQNPTPPTPPPTTPKPTQTIRRKF